MSEIFERQRPFLRNLAYRMLGTVSETDDILQDAWLRWRDAEPAHIAAPRAYLARIVTNLCVDHLTSARARRELYVGQWLPEPLLDPPCDASDPARHVELASDLSFALLHTLERLTSLERAAFLLHDVFEFDFATIATMLGRTEESCRQLAVRARQHVRTGGPRFRVSRAAGARLCEAFVQAIVARDPVQLTAMLTEGAGFNSDGGGVVAAVPRPVFGAEQVTRVVLGFAKGYTPDAVRVEFAWINGDPGLLLWTTAGALVQAIVLEPAPEGRISAIYVQRNPHKLRHLRAATTTPGTG